MYQCMACAFIYYAQPFICSPHRLNDGGALNNASGISGVVAYSPSFFPREFLDNDYNLRRKCSIGGEVDTLYRTRRPPVTCAIYQPPRRSEC